MMDAFGHELIVEFLDPFVLKGLDWRFAVLGLFEFLVVACGSLITVGGSFIVTGSSLIVLGYFFFF